MNTVLVACPGYEVPKSAFIKNLEEIWTPLQKSQIAELGIDLQHIRKAYKKLATMPLIHLDRNLPMVQQQSVVELVFNECKLMGRSKARLLNLGKSLSDGKKAEAAAILLIGTPKDPEACAVVAVILMLLQKTLQVGVSFASFDIEELRLQMKDKATHLAVVLSQGILSLPSVARVIVEASNEGLGLVPITADPGFEFPNLDFYQDLLLGQVLHEPEPGQECPSLDRLCETYKQMFASLSCRFTPHGSERLQLTEVSEMLPHFRSGPPKFAPGRTLELKGLRSGSSGGARRTLSSDAADPEGRAALPRSSVCSSASTDDVGADDVGAEVLAKPESFASQDFD